MASAPGFPQMMIHPQHRAAVVREFSSADGLPGAPERFPPVEVHNEDQEAMLRSRGYLRYGEALPKMIEFNEYPKLMRHPEHVPAQKATRASQVGENGLVFLVDVPAKAAVYPDVTVRDADEEAEWTTKGWALPGRSDGMAFERAKAAPGKPGEEFPKWVDGVLVQDPDAPVDLSKEYPKWLHFKDGSESRLVSDPAEEKRVLAARGETVQQPAPKPYVPLVATKPVDPEYEEFLAWKAARAAEAAKIDPEADERAALISLAEETGVEIDKRWGLKRLREAVMGSEAA
ncbi:MAG: hypothetical protein EPO08_03425, partial [Rhodospirillaceae bacterium]